MFLIIRRYNRQWALMVLLILLLAGCAGASAAPKLIPDTSVAPDLAELAAQTWAQFLETFDARRDCFGDLKLRTVNTLDGRARYDPQSAILTIEVPATAALLKGALVHEFAHHVEFQCAAHGQLRPIFVAAQNLPPDTPWFDGPSWAETPSEQYAEAAVILVLGRRQLPTEAHVSSAAVEALAEWARGE